MKLGILVTTDKYRDDIIGLTEAVLKRGHAVIIFFMDEGCRLAIDKDIVALKDRTGVSMSLCDLNRGKIGIAKQDIREDIICGSQYDNALMNREADKVIVF
ncbi:MAG: hypothetical protein QMD01_07245 [Thermodesulfovibrionales bacterium]|nr:hypothetical protein [Thermodesulfovibrionales bacterium]